MSWNKRAARDVNELISKGYKVYSEKGEGEDLNLSSFLVDFTGPKDTPYENTCWTLRFTIPTDFPFKSPSVGFLQKIFHPNVDEASGSICLDSLNTGWIPSFTLRHIAEDLVPLLLSYPNPDDPLNREAASLMKSNKENYTKFVTDHSKNNSKKRAREGEDDVASSSSKSVI